MRTSGSTLLVTMGAWLLGSVSAHAGTRVRLVPQNVSSHALNPVGHYLPGEIVNIHVYLEQTSAGPDHLLRTATFHFDATDVALVAGIGPITFAPFSTVGHDVDASLTAGPPGIGVDYIFDPGQIGPNPAIQLLLPGSGAAALVARFPITMPTTPGEYVLDVMNAAGPTANDQAAIAYGFGCAANSPCAPLGSHPDGTFPVTTDVPGAGLIGGTLNLVTNTPTINVSGPSSVFDSGPYTHPSDGGNLWRSSQQVIRIRFTHDIAATHGPLSPIPGLEIKRLMAGPTPATGPNFAGGTFGPDLNTGTNFSFRVEPDPTQAGTPRILHIQDINPSQLIHRAWYTVQNLGTWSAAPPFRMDYRMMIGDVDNNGIVNTTDVGQANWFANVTDVCSFGTARGDIDGNRICNAIDIAIANSSIPTGKWLPKPAGHP